MGIAKAHLFDELVKDFKTALKLEHERIVHEREQALQAELRHLREELTNEHRSCAVTSDLEAYSAPLTQKLQSQACHTKHSSESYLSNGTYDSNLFQRFDPKSSTIDEAGSLPGASSGDSSMFLRQTLRNAKTVATIHRLRELASTDELNPYTLRRPWKELLRHDLEFQLLMLEAFLGVVIALNAIVIGVSIDMYPESKFWIAADIVFAVIFVCAVPLKMHLMGRRYCKVLEAKWNIVDITIAILGVLEILFSVLNIKLKTAELSLFKVIRLGRLTRMVRLFSLPIFKDLRMMVAGAVGGLPTLLWSTLLIVIPLYTVAVMLRDTIGRIEDDENIAHLFSSVSQAFFTLFRCIAGNDCNNHEGKPLFVYLMVSYSWGYSVLYCFLIIAMTFGLFNVIVAIYVENTVAAAKYNDTLVQRSRLADQRRLASKSIELLSILWRETTGQTIGSHEEFCAFATAEMEVSKELFTNLLSKNDEVQKIFNDLDIPEEDHFDLFETLDADGGGTLTADELVRGIARLRGQARRSDIVNVGLIARSSQDSLQLLSKAARAQSKALASLKDTVCSQVDLLSAMQTSIEACLLRLDVLDGKVP